MDNEELNAVIEHFIEHWSGTATGVAVKNMYEHGDTYEHICEAMKVDFEDYKEN